ncbi:MAG: ribosome maturation factor RimP [Rhodospirillales bacterium]|nr:ribosome maturation factor RimP [Rhodospirillales bacterium]
MSLAGEIEGLINRTVEAMGFRVVRVKMFTHPRRTLQIMAERADGSPVIVDDCTLLSRAIGPLLDAEDPIPGAYDLEVSSTGIDRPLVRPEDYTRLAGFEAKLVVDPPQNGQRKFRGRVEGMAGGHVRLQLEGDRVADLPFEVIVEGQLVLTDELMKTMTSPRDEASATETE